MPHGPIRTRPVHRIAALCLAQLLMLQPLLPVRMALANPTHPGKWTGTRDLRGTAVNLVLLPGWSPSYHSRVMWWVDDHEGAANVKGNVLGWNPPNDTSTNSGTFPATFDSLGLEDPPLLHGAASNLFCSGAALLADGRLFVTGGTDRGESGTVSALFFDPKADSNGQWTRTDDMAYRRWYPDNVVLPDGRVVTASGSSYAHYFAVGGFIDAAPDTHTRILQRVGVAIACTLESLAVPLKNTPQAEPFDRIADGASVLVDQNRMLVYGGLDASLEPSQKAYLLSRVLNEFGADYKFQWGDVTQTSPQGQAFVPVARVGATLLTLGSNTDLLLIGGKEPNEVSDRVWRGTLSGNTISWVRLNNLTSTPLPRLHGHGAVYDKGVNRVFVFGGAGAAAETPTNADVYSLKLGALATSETLFVAKATVSGPNRPNARSYASLTHVPFQTRGVPTLHADTGRTRAILFGGRTTSDGYSDSLHAMWINSATEVIWEAVALDPTSPRPTARRKHAAALDANTLSLVLSGGETAPGTGSTEVWTHSVLCGSDKRCNLPVNQRWETQPPLERPVRGHAAVAIGPEPAFSRFPEVFHPSAPDPYWATQSSVPHWQEWFPFGFAAPRRSDDPAETDVFRVFYAGPEKGSPTLQLGPGPPTWSNMTSGTADFFAGAAVMYRPGKVMKSGTRDTRGDTESTVFGRTAVIDLKAQTPAWTEAAPANQMISRRNHNLVILPTGEVLVVGGARFGDNTKSNDLNCVKKPQIWNPDTLAAGHWYGNDTTAFKFDSSSVRRHYHSTAVLLPDGRVLAAGGSSDTLQNLSDIYSPYYLFNASGGPAARPVIQSAPDTVVYGERFPLCMAGITPALAKVSLVRPGATTHGFDQNQRFLWLTAQAAPPGAGTRFVVTAPADSMDAPPGDYMLFALTSSGTPSIARWIRLRTAKATMSHPTVVNNLAKLCSNGTSVEFSWLPPAGDSATALTCPVPAARYDLRYRLGLMPGWTEFGSALSVSGMPLPNDPGPGQPQSISVSGLALGQQYTFRMVSKNHASGEGNWSALGNAVTFTFLDEECGGSGGGGGGCCQEGGSARQANGAWLRRPIGGGTGSEPGFLENTLLANLAPDSPATDVLRLPYGPKWTTAGARVRLSRSGSLGTRFTRVRLLGVSVPEGQDAFTAGDRVLSGTLSAPLAIRHTDGRDLTASLAADTAFDGHVGDTLLVQFAETTPARIALETSGAHLVRHPARTGIEVQCETAEGWSTVAHHDPRALRSDALHEVPSAGRVRLVFQGDHRLHGIARFAPGQPATVFVYEPQAFTHSSTGPMAAALGEDGALLAPGESMLADFAVNPEQSTGLDWFLEVVGEHEAVAGSGTTVNRQDSDREIPLRFALEQNRPNPFEAVTSIGFELPRRAPVRLEVYDLLGRRVAVLVQATYEPGRHSITWDRRGMRGTRVPAGVYTCRYTAGEHREQRRLIVFP